MFSQIWPDLDRSPPHLNGHFSFSNIFEYIRPAVAFALWAKNNDDDWADYAAGGGLAGALQMCMWIADELEHREWAGNDRYPAPGC